MKTLRAAFRTFGCKLNQLETEAIADAFARAGFVLVPFPEPSDICVFNTCTVTGKAEQKARREIRLALRANPDAVVIVTGCYAEIESETVAALAPRTVILPGSVKDRLLGYAKALNEAAADGFDLLETARVLAARSRGEPGDPFAFEPSDTVFRSRASLKIEDGCDNACAYCRVTLARGKSRSLAAAEVVARARRLEARGMAEIVLSGVNLSQYRSGDLDFPGLLELLVAETDTTAFRVSSYEPDKVDDRFIRAFIHPRVRPHLHLAAQSGSNATLVSMGRGYGAKAILSAVRRAREARNDPFLAADIILGFPGETESDFAQTWELLETADFAWIHAFPFSPRPGTRAATMVPRIPERVTFERAKRVATLAASGKARYIARWAGKTVEAVMETCGPAHDSGSETRIVRASSENYLDLAITGVPEGFSGACRCRIHDSIYPFGKDTATDAGAIFLDRIQC